MNRRNLLQVVVAAVVTPFAAFKVKGEEWRLRVLTPTFKQITGSGSFNEFLNTPYHYRMSPPAFVYQEEMRKAIQRDRKELPHTLGEDKREVWFDDKGRKHDRHLEKTIRQAIMTATISRAVRDHSPETKPPG